MQEVIEQVLEAEQRGEQILQDARKHAESIISQQSGKQQEIIQEAKSRAAEIRRNTSEEAATQIATLRETSLTEYTHQDNLESPEIHAIVDKLVDLVGRGN